MVQTRTRTGRAIKKPEFYTPEETVLEDDYTPEEHDSDLGSEICTDDEIYSDEESESVSDDEGSLKDFIVDDDEESEEEDT
jgi:hypothetical protein